MSSITGNTGQHLKNNKAKRFSRLMKIDSSKIKLSKNDIKKELRLPTRLTPALVELMGIHIGDGNMYVYDRTKNKVRWVTYSVSYFGNLDTDMLYFETYLQPLFKRLFGIKTKIFRSTRDNTCIIKIYSKGVVLFLKELGIMPGKKIGGIPAIIKGNKTLLSHFLRGLGDTDFSLSLKNKEGKLYPVIAMSCANHVLTKEVSDALKSYGINNYLALDVRRTDKRFPGKVYTTNFVEVNGKKNLAKWLGLIGFSNPARLSMVKKFDNELLKIKRPRQDSNLRPHG